MPFGFDLNNSPPAMITAPSGAPIVLLSSSGTKLMAELSARAAPSFVACLRNLTATIAAVPSGADVVVIGAGTRGEFRDEDQLCCAWIAEGLAARGFRPDGEAQRLIAEWHGASVDRIASGASADYLRRSDQEGDLAFVLEHVDDIGDAFVLADGEVRRLAEEAASR
jgi:2-phosphosulfolactate phosphatase